MNKSSVQKLFKKPKKRLIMTNCIFEPRTDTSSATICKHCGQEKFLHNQVPDIRNMVEDDIEKLAREYFTDTNPSESVYQNGLHIGFKAGYNKAKETLYTEEQLRSAMKYASEITNNKMKYMEDYIQSLKQPKKD